MLGTKVKNVFENKEGNRTKNTVTFHKVYRKEKKYDESNQADCIFARLSEKPRLLFCQFKKTSYLCTAIIKNGALAHLARALDWQSRGNEFDSRMLHKT